MRSGDVPIGGHLPRRIDPAIQIGPAIVSHQVRAVDRTLMLGPKPLLMGIVNASPDSFSDGGVRRTLGDRLALAEELLADGADILDVGGESATTDHPAVNVKEEIRRVLPVIERAVGEFGAIVSVDTYKPAVARAAIAAGAVIVNDVSGLRDPELAAVCASEGAALVIMHTVAAPKTRLHDRGMYGDPIEDVHRFLRDRVEVAVARGMDRNALIIDPGPDFSKTPAQTIEVLAGVRRLHDLGLPLLMAISRKDFIGALTGRRPRGRLAGTLAALAHGVRMGGHIFRVHDVAAASDYLRVYSALEGEIEVDPGLAVGEDVRYDRVFGSTDPPEDHQRAESTDRPGDHQRAESTDPPGDL